MAAPKNAPESPEKPAPVKVTDLPDGKIGQATEASEEPTTFVMGDGSEFTFHPVADWTLDTVIAYTNGQVGSWLKGALQDDGDLAKLAKKPAREVGRIQRYYDDRMGVSRGESPGSSDS